jgi:Heparinase II/III-like protein
VEVDGQDQSEVWGSFRVGRRARPTIHGATDDGATIVIDASHDGYRHLPGSPTHRRHWTLSAESMHISDRIEGEGHHSCVARWVSTPQAHATADLLSTSGSVGAFATATATIATAFGQTEATVVGTYTTSGQLPLTIDTTLSFAAVAASVGLAPAIGEL